MLDGTRLMLGEIIGSPGKYRAAYVTIDESLASTADRAHPLAVRYEGERFVFLECTPHTADFPALADRIRDKVLLDPAPLEKLREQMRTHAAQYAMQYAEQLYDALQELRPHISDYVAVSAVEPLWRLTEALLVTVHEHPNLQEKYRNDLRWFIRNTHAEPWGDDLIRYVSYQHPPRDDPVLEAYLGMLVALNMEDYHLAKACREVVIGARKSLRLEDRI